ncbi:MAG: PEP-CTERM sorting domain-containing protein [Gemmataceae bacterium]
MTRFAFLFGVVAIALSANPAHAQIVLGQIDNFEDGTAQSWGNITTNVTTGGPTGANDNFLQVATNGSAGGASSRMLAINSTQWAGNYTTAGVSAVEFDVKNFWTSPMTIRAGFVTTTGAAAKGYISNGTTVNADGLWHHVFVSLAAGNMNAVNGPPAYSTVLAGSFVDFRILYSTGADMLGDFTSPDATFMGLDNIHATTVPEPTSLTLFSLVGLAGISRMRRRATFSVSSKGLDCNA